MAQNTVVGIDIGTHGVKVVVAELPHKEKALPKIIGTGYAESKGLRHGYILTFADTVKPVKDAVRQAEKSSNSQIKRAFLGIGGVGLTGTVGQASVIVSKGDSEITDLDIRKVQEACENELPSAFAANRKIVLPVPISYKIDGRPVLGRPQGMKGMKLEGRTLFISSIEQHLNDMIQAVGDAGVEVEDVMPSPIAASFITVNKTQKIAGCVLALVGAETVSIVVFENNIPISLEVFPIGSLDITHDIALGFKIPLEDAENLKIRGEAGVVFSRKKLDDIINARLTDIFELIENHLEKIGRNELLPAGIILTGGGSSLAGIEEEARSALKLPARVAHTPFSGDNRGLGDETWSIAYGLCVLGLMQESDRPMNGIMEGGWSKLSKWVRRFLP